MATPHPPPTRRSVWTPRQKLARLVWGTLGRWIWVLVPPARATLLRLFGGRVGRGCRLPAAIEITIPWNIELGDAVEIGAHVILYSLGTITIGDGTVIDYGAHLCAGTHDMRDSRFPLLRPPIVIGPDSFVGIDAYVGPDVTLGPRTIVHARASVYRSSDGDVELRGNPAKPYERAESKESAA